MTQLSTTPTPRSPLSRRTVLGLGATAAAAFTTACTAGSAGAPSGADGGEAADTLLINTTFVYSTLDPGRAYEQTGYLVLHGLYDSLMTFDGDDVTAPVPNLAESHEVSADGLTHTFRLREGLTFSDGAPLTSDDVLFSMNRLLNLKGSSVGFFSGLTFSAPDPATFVVTSAEPDNGVPTLMAMPASSVVNSAAAKAAGASDAADADASDTAQAAFDATSMGSGPYKLESNDPGNEIVLVPNENHWGEPAGFSRVVLRNVDVQNQKLSIAKSSSAEIALDLTGNLLDGLPDSLDVSSNPDTMYMLYMNTDPAVSPATSNPDWRAALRASIDYDGLAALFGEGGEKIAGYVAQTYPGALPLQDAPVQDLDAARALLAASGAADTVVRFIYPAITYRGVDLATITTKVQSDAAAAGIQLELTPLAMPAFLEEQRSGEAVLGFTPQQLAYPRPESLVSQLSPGGTNGKRCRWEAGDPGADRALDAAAAVSSAGDESARSRALQEWQRVMLEVSPFIGLAQNSGTVVSTPQVTGVEHTAAGWFLDLGGVEPT
ncbi:ABC transporter substrate-binding protein [Kineococcus sp. SYSU DK018]|uniref:ABC transporter substrate-binding protein n=1 Tax=Kineococcus sp. SYSU DK018 TaxID=3383139 RepID=UPI003D7C4EC9